MEPLTLDDQVSSFGLPRRWLQGGGEDFCEEPRERELASLSYPHNFALGVVQTTE